MKRAGCIRAQQLRFTILLKFNFKETSATNRLSDLINSVIRSERIGSGGSRQQTETQSIRLIRIDGYPSEQHRALNSSISNNHWRCYQL